MTSRDPPRLTREQQARALELARKLYGGETLDAFIRRLSPHHPPPRHFAPLLEQLQRAAGRPVNVCFSMPPRHGKTTMVQHAIPWWLSRFPGDTCAYASYSSQQAWSKSRVMRELAGRAGVRLAPDAANLAEWRTTAGGGLLSVGAGSGLTGQGVSGLMVVDDPFKNPEEAQSSVIRDKVGEWFDGVVQTRIEGASTIVMHTRWHEDDLIGRLAADKDFTVINLPALAEPGDILGRAEGEPLWPERFGREYLEKRRRRNAWLFSALYQGRPIQRGKKVFGPARYYDPATLDLTGCDIIIGFDPAATEGTANDFSVAVALAVRGRDPATRVGYVLDVLRRQMLVPDFLDLLVPFRKQHHGARVAAEAVGGFKAIPGLLRRLVPNIQVIEAPAVGDKLLRAQEASSAWNDAEEPRLLVPSNNPEWLGDFLLELSRFTGVRDAHDDQVDALSHAWNSAGIGVVEPYTPPTHHTPRRMPTSRPRRY